MDKDKYPPFQPFTLSPQNVYVGGQLLNLGANLVRAGEKRTGNAYQPHFQLYSTSGLAGLGTMIAPGIGTAIGGALGLGLDAIKFVQGKKQYEADVYKQKWNKAIQGRAQDRQLMDYTYQR